MKPNTEHVRIEGAAAIVTLSRPIVVDGAERAALTMREPTARDMESFGAIAGTDATREITTFANLCEVPADAIRSLPLRDYARLQAAFGLFTD